MKTRATLTIDPDNAARLSRLQKERDLSFKEVVNSALRNGLDKLESPQREHKPFRIPVLECGKPTFNSPEELKQLTNEIQFEEDMRKLGVK
jgi:hypothetical protein